MSPQPNSHKQPDTATAAGTVHNSGDESDDDGPEQLSDLLPPAGTTTVKYLSYGAFLYQRRCNLVQGSIRQYIAGLCCGAWSMKRAFIVGMFTVWRLYLAASYSARLQLCSTVQYRAAQHVLALRHLVQ
jgi:hypothetical protein